MKQLRPVAKTEKILFPLLGGALICLLVPKATPLMGMLMVGNLFRESGVVKRLSEGAQNELMNIVTIFLGITVGATMEGGSFLQARTIFVLMRPTPPQRGPFGQPPQEAPFSPEDLEIVTGPGPGAVFGARSRHSAAP